MIRRVNLSILLMVALSAFAVSAFSQSAPVTGRVMLKKSDGTMVPLAGAVVKPYQIDIKSSAPADKTDKKGQFNFAGLKLGAVYVLSVSGPGAAPTYVPNVRAGNENLTVTVSEGDGREFTEDEVRTAIKQGSAAAAAASPGSGSGEKPAELTAEQKKQQAEYEAKLKEITAKNEKALKANEVVNKSLQEGNAAYTAKNYDAAIASYTTGIDADPDFVGSAPVMLNNRGAALTARGVLTFNQNAKSTDSAVRAEANKKVKQDFADAIDSYDRSLKVLKTAAPGDGSDPKIVEQNRLNALKGARETFRLMALTEQADETKTPIAKAVLTEYATVETDPVKRDETKLILADLYRVVGDSNNAIIAYREVLQTSPDNMDALAGLGFSLVNAGYVNNDKTQLQEGANYLQRFASSAPDSNKFKADAVGLIDTLKKEQNVTPVKGGATKKKG